MSAMKLSGTMRSSLKEAEQLINEYFRVFPRIKVVLDFLGQWGIKKGWIQTLAPFYRKRWFPFWKYSQPFIEAHISGIEYNPTLGSIERKSKNQPIQGSSADQVKLAMVLIYQYKHEHTYEGVLVDDLIHLVAQVHDQVTTTAQDEPIAKWWSPILDRLMCEAAKFVVHTGILKADTNISTCWTK